MDPRIKFGLRNGDCFIKRCHFLSFSSVAMIFFLTSRANFVYWASLPKKKQKPDVGSCQSTKIDTFLDQIP